MQPPTPPGATLFYVPHPLKLVLKLSQVTPRTHTHPHTHTHTHTHAHTHTHTHPHHTHPHPPGVDKLVVNNQILISATKPQQLKAQWTTSTYFFSPFFNPSTYLCCYKSGQRKSASGQPDLGFSLVAERTPARAHAHTVFPTHPLCGDVAVLDQVHLTRLLLDLRLDQVQGLLCLGEDVE